MTGVTVLFSYRVDLQRRSVFVLAEESGRQRDQDGGQAGRAAVGYEQLERTRANLWWWVGFIHRGQLPHRHQILLTSRLDLPAPRRLHVQHSTGLVPPGGVAQVQMR